MLNQGQQEAVSHREGPCLTLAGPGSGKTTVIVERICQLLEAGIPGEEIFVLTFTKAAAENMRERFLIKAGGQDRNGGGRVFFGTFHSLFFQILRYSGAYGENSILTGEEKEVLLEEAVLRTGIFHEREGWKEEVLEEIKKVKEEGKSRISFVSESCREEEFLTLFQEYERLRKKKRKLDFEDILLECAELLEKNETLRQIWQKRCSYLMIDEYQDSNPIQCKLAVLLAAPENHILVVGDDDQSIYGFRGAAPERMREFIREYPERKQILLSINYRCPREVTKAAARLIRKNRNRLEKEIISWEDNAFEGGLPEKMRKGTHKRFFSDVLRTLWREKPYEADLPETEESESGQSDTGRTEGGLSEIRSSEEVIYAGEYPSLLEENEEIIRWICRYREEGIPYEEMAVLYRTKGNSRQLRRLLRERGIPFTVKGENHSLYTHWICQDFRAYLAVAGGSKARKDWLRILSHPERYLSRQALGKEEVSLEDLFCYYERDAKQMKKLDRLAYDLELLRRIPPYGAIQHIRKGMGYDKYLQSLGEEADSLCDKAEEIQETADGCLSYKEWEKVMQEDKESFSIKKEEPGVRLMTIHGAKGLEFSVVFLVDANEGILPYKRALTEEGVEEERRLFYVAMTRTKKKLHVTWTKERFHKQQAVSRFVKEAGILPGKREKTYFPVSERKQV